MSWNYRVFRDSNNLYSIIETYYSDAGDPIAHCSSHMDDWESEEELKESLKMMQDAFNKATLTPEHFPWAKNYVE